MGRLVMVLSGRTILMALLVLLIATGKSLGGRRWTVHKSFSGGIHSPSLHIDNEKAEQAWIRCIKKLRAKKLVVDNQALAGSRLALSKKANLKQTARVQSQPGQLYLECLEEQHLLSLVYSREADSNSWSAEHFELISGLSNPPRKYLTTKQHTSEPPHGKPHSSRPRNLNALSISSAGAINTVSTIALPISASAPPYSSPILAPEPSESPRSDGDPPVNPQSDSDPPVNPRSDSDPPVNPQSDSDPPVNPRSDNDPPVNPRSDNDSPVNPRSDNDPPVNPRSDSDPPLNLSPRPTPSPRFHKHRAPTSPPGSYSVPDNDNDNDNSNLMEIIIAASITAAATILLVSLLFFCIFKDRNIKVGPGGGQKDERPLLNLGLSNLSAVFSGSPGKSSSMRSSSNNGVHTNTRRTPSILTNLSSKFSRHASTVAVQSSLEATSSEGLGPLKPPPGRMIPTPSKPEQPPLPPRPPRSPAPAPPPPPPAPAPAPPPPPKARPPPLPPKGMPGKHHKRNSNSSDEGSQDGSGVPKAKLKPFFWDKVLADPDHSMVWHEIKAGSFQFNEEMMESLFGYASTDGNKIAPKKESSSLEPVQFIKIIDSKKAQNLSILLKALNVTAEEVTDAIHEGNELPIELIQTLLKMAPTTEEELKLRLFTGDITQLGPAERFLKVLVEIPFAFKRLEFILFMISFDEETTSIKESLATLEVASSKLRHNRLFLKLLEAVLKTGNRMNDGTYRGGAQAFKLDTLLKLSDVKGTDGKITLLHFVVQEIIRSEGVRAARSDKASHGSFAVKPKDVIEENSHEAAVYYRNLGLQVVSALSTELEDVKKAAVIDVDSVALTLSKLSDSLKKAKEFLNSELMTLEEESEYRNTLSTFLGNAEGEINHLIDEEKRIMALVQSTADYFHGHAGKNEGLRLFVIVRDFLRMVDKSCKEVRDTPWEPAKTGKKTTQTKPSSPESCQQSPDIRQRLFPAIVDRRMYDSSSDDESLSP